MLQWGQVWKKGHSARPAWAWEWGTVRAGVNPHSRPVLALAGRDKVSLSHCVRQAGCRALSGLGLFLYWGRKMRPADGTIKEHSGG